MIEPNNGLIITIIHHTRSNLVRNCCKKTTRKRFCKVPPGKLNSRRAYHQNFLHLQQWRL